MAQSPYSIHREGLCPSSGDINRLMMKAASTVRNGAMFRCTQNLLILPEHAAGLGTSVQHLVFWTTAVRAADAADAEVVSSGRTMQDMPSKIGRQVEDSLNSLAEIFGNGVARALSRKHESGGIDSITISTGSDKKKKKMKKKKTKPPKIHLVHPAMVHAMQKHEKGEESEGRGFASGVQSWVIGERSVNSSSRRGRGLLTDLWGAGEEYLDAAAEHALKSDQSEDGITDKSSLQEQRGKKKKKKKAILKLLILGAVLKAKIGTLLQILSFKLQVKFFLIALIGLGINLARLWIDIKNKHNHQPQKRRSLDEPTPAGAGGLEAPDGEETPPVGRRHPPEIPIEALANSRLEVPLGSRRPQTR
ncbi:hypothetical protein evm_013678 [Chilo suppressalis]|nr:hypothetical protein evm_013678 [Chilo suppressalis]